MGLSEKPALLCVFSDYLGLAVMLPTLPHYIASIVPDNSAISPEIWTGAILSAQFIAVIPGNLLWGHLTDRVGGRRTLQLTMATDVM